MHSLYTGFAIEKQQVTLQYPIVLQWNTHGKPFPSSREQAL